MPYYLLNPSYSVFFSPDVSMAHCQQAGWKRDAGDPSVQLQQSLFQQVRCTSAPSLSLNRIYHTKQHFRVNCLWFQCPSCLPVTACDQFGLSRGSCSSGDGKYTCIPWELVLNWLNCVCNRLQTTELAMNEFHIRRGMEIVKQH